MNKIEDELQKFIEDLYLRIKSGQTPETKNTELKSAWYNLNKAIKGDQYKINISKFIKEIAALANGYGPWAGHLIIGLSETGIITNSPLSESGLKDETELYSLVVSCLDKPIRFEYYEVLINSDGEPKTISVIRVPVSLDKPHVMYEYVTEKGRYENYTPVKKGTAVRSATRSDLDLMYYDKKNIIPEYALSIKSYNTSEIQIQPLASSLHINIPVIFENFGRKPMIVIKGFLIITEANRVKLDTEIKLTLGAYSLANNSNSKSQINQQPIIISSNQALAYICHFYTWQAEHFEVVKSGNFTSYFLVEDVFGNKYESNGLFRTEGK